MEEEKRTELREGRRNLIAIIVCHFFLWTGKLNKGKDNIALLSLRFLFFMAFI